MRKDYNPRAYASAARYVFLEHIVDWDGEVPRYRTFNLTHAQAVRLAKELLAAVEGASDKLRLWLGDSLAEPEISPYPRKNP